MPGRVGRREDYEQLPRILGRWYSADVIFKGDEAFLGSGANLPDFMVKQLQSHPEAKPEWSSPVL